MTAFIIGHMQIHSRDWMEEYFSKISDVIEENNGQLLMRGFSPEHMQGSVELPDASFILEFPDREHASRFWNSEEFQKLLMPDRSGAMIDASLVDKITPTVNQATQTPSARTETEKRTYGHKNKPRDLLQRKPTRKPWRKYLRWIEAAALVAAIVGMFVSFASLWISRSEIQESRRERGADAVARAWTTLSTRSIGNSGKVDALEYLASIGEALENIDLSCEAMGGGPSTNLENACERATYLFGLNFGQFPGTRLNHTSFRGSDLREANFDSVLAHLADFSYASLSGSVFSRSDISFSDMTRTAAPESDFGNAVMALVDASFANFSSSKFYNTNMSGINLERARLFNAAVSHADLYSATLVGADLSFATIEDTSLFRADLSGARLNNTTLARVHVSGADFSGASINDRTVFRDAWAWSDMLPAGLPVGLVSVCTRAPNSSIYVRPDNC